MGDFSENAEYQLAKGRLRGLNTAILKIQNQLDRSLVIPKPKDNETIQVGHTITLESENKEKIYQILGSSETNPALGIISYTSPMGGALLGLKVGDTMKITIGNNHIVYTVRAITLNASV